VNAPRIGRRDVADAVNRYFGARRDHFLIAFHGSGNAEVIADAAGGPVRVQPVSCELDLRRCLLEIAEADRIAFLVPWRGDLPLDLRGRFARKGRIELVGRQIRLRTLFGAAEIDEDVWQSPLPEYLLAHHGDLLFAVPGGRLTVASMWCAFLERVWGVDAGGEVALDIFLGFAAVDGHGPALVASFVERGGAAPRAALDVELGLRMGPAGPLVFAAWSAGRGRQALELGILAEAGSADDPGFQTFAGMKARDIFATAAGPGAITALGGAAGAALRYVEKREGAAAVRALVRAADEMAREPVDVRPGLGGSTRLRSAWSARLDRLGGALAAVASSPGPGTVGVAVDALRALSSHEAYGDPDERRILERAEMAVRLGAWLARRGETVPAPASSSYGDVENLAGWYVAEGGFLDWARRGARGTAVGELGRAIHSILASVDQARTELDRRFARALPAWLEARRPAERVLPIDQVARRVIGRYLDEVPGRRLLVILMDGMAWAQAAEVITSLGRESTPWGPLAWHGLSRHRLGEASYPPVLAGFPTLTDVSRSAFFAGAPMPSGPEHATSKDPERWKGNAEIRRFCDATDVPQLLLRGEGQARDGSASEAALSLVADDRRRVVALVINAIDSSLKGDAAQRQAWTVDSIQSLRDVLDRAGEVGRAVLLCADHGHVPADRLAPCGAARLNGARWRTWKEGDTVADYEVLLTDCDGVWVPRGSDGVVLISDDAHVYGGSGSAGEHGGASLAEVVAPCILLGCEDNPAVEDDPGQAIRPLGTPAWWTFDRADARPTAPGPVRAPRRRRGSSERQLPLLEVPAVVPPSRAADAAAPSSFAGSALLIARALKPARHAEVVRAVEFLLERGGSAPAAAFAAAMAIFPTRVGGFVTTLQEILNVDGYPILRHDPHGKQVILDRVKLAQQFEVVL